MRLRRVNACCVIQGITSLIYAVKPGEASINPTRLTLQLTAIPTKRLSFDGLKRAILRISINRRNSWHFGALGRTSFHKRIVCCYSEEIGFYKVVHCGSLNMYYVVIRSSEEWICHCLACRLQTSYLPPSSSCA